MSLESDVRLLADVPLLSEFTEDKLRLLAFSAENRQYRDGQRLFTAGDRADSGFVIAGGKVALHAPGEEHPFDMAGVGRLIGEVALIVDGERPATAIAVGDVAVIQIRRPLFRRMLDEYPDVAERLQSRFAARLTETTRALMAVKTRLDRIPE